MVDAAGLLLHTQAQSPKTNKSLFSAALSLKQEAGKDQGKK